MVDYSDNEDEYPAMEPRHKELENIIAAGPEGSRASNAWVMRCANYMYYMRRRDALHKTPEELAGAIEESFRRYRHAHGQEYTPKDGQEIIRALSKIDREMSGKGETRVHEHLRTSVRGLEGIELLSQDTDACDKLFGVKWIPDRDTKSLASREFCPATLRRGGDWIHPIESTILWLRACYRPDDILFIGSKYDATGDPDVRRVTVRTALEWVRWCRCLINDGCPHLPESMNQYCIQPLTGRVAQGCDGQETARGLGCLAPEFRYVLFEGDSLKLTQQIEVAYQKINNWQIRAVTYSGSKSTHILCRVPAVPNTGPVNWQSHVVNSPMVYNMVRCGADIKALTANQLSRTPGAIRIGDTGTPKVQRLFWVGASPEDIPPRILRPGMRETVGYIPEKTWPGLDRC